MQRVLVSVLLLTVFLVAGFAAAVSAQEGQVIAGLSADSSAGYYHTLIGTIAGDWQDSGQLFTTLQGQWFWKAFLLTIIVIPVVFLLHYLIIGPQHYDHDGEQILFFPLLVRIVHFFAAVSFSFLAITGLMVIFGSFLGGGSVIRFARYVHLAAAMVFVLPALLMFIIWLKDMFPKLHDLSWLIIAGGYLSKKKEPVPAGKFNAGQKMYFWYATVGGGFMAYSGYILWGMTAAVDTLRFYAVLHNILGLCIVAFYLTHVYMSVFAIAGSLNSMKTGYKPKDEVDTLHSLYKY